MVLTTIINHFILKAMEMWNILQTGGDDDLNCFLVSEDTIILSLKMPYIAVKMNFSFFPSRERREAA